MGKPGIPRHDSVILTTIGDNTSIKGGRSWPLIKRILKIYLNKFKFERIGKTMNRTELSFNIVKHLTLEIMP